MQTYEVTNETTPEDHFDPGAPALCGAAVMPFSADAMTVTLSLGELQRDSNGEIVVVNSSGIPTLQIVTELKLLRSGVVADHSMESGFQVAGFNYWLFEDGTKLFYPTHLSIVLQNH
ncbi:hypothetical protein [Dongia deserti]|uniref:hypothetical protein n=1 Tax=Dongia deserti TaxID=2268030 RepID=UPI0013C3F8EF|nr:hypothetical protein [Dongia deserti]